jgi:hypothetical protein
MMANALRFIHPSAIGVFPAVHITGSTEAQFDGRSSGPQNVSPLAGLMIAL